MAAEPKRWYAHEYPDRPLAEGVHLCCCLLCTVALERSAQKDAQRPILFHTGWGISSMYARGVAMWREDVHLHDMLAHLGEPAGNWVKDVRVGPRLGRPRKNWPRDRQPVPLDRWPVCTHCGPLSDATFAEVALLDGRRRRRPSAKQIAADDASRAARAALVAEVEAAMQRHRSAAVRQFRDQRRPVHALPDADDVGDFGDDW